MLRKIDNFSVYGLHERWDYEVNFTENKLILVGQNGSGKSTAITMLYFYLTNQWDRLKDYKFSKLSIKSNNETISIDRNSLDKLVNTSSQDSEVFGTFDDLVSMIEKKMEDRKSKEQNESNKTVEDSNKDYKFLENEEKLLFLPTYRRIEQSFDSIYRIVEKRRREYFRNINFDFSAEFHKYFENKNFKELTEFGMSDVEKIISKKETELKDSFRTGLNDLTGNYLKNIIQKKHESIEFTDIKKNEFKNMDSILDRIEDRILSKAEKDDLKERVRTIQEVSSINTPDNKIIMHFLLQLVELYTSQLAKEKNLDDFIKVCNFYLEEGDKEVFFDNKNFQIFIRQKNEIQNSKDSDSKINLHVLSSGEKQIISLFSHIYLSDIKHFFIIIDEPELSLSVPWQKRFLPDILQTGRCSGLVSVTHSPFIYENDLLPYVREISEFRSIIKK